MGALTLGSEMVSRGNKPLSGVGKEKPKLKQAGAGGADGVRAHLSPAPRPQDCSVTKGTVDPWGDASWWAQCFMLTGPRCGEDPAERAASALPQPPGWWRGPVWVSVGRGGCGLGCAPFLVRWQSHCTFLPEKLLNLGEHLLFWERRCR